MGGTSKCREAGRREVGERGLKNQTILRYRRATRFRSLPSSSTSMASDADCMRARFWLWLCCSARFRELLVRLLLESAPGVPLAPLPIAMEEEWGADELVAGDDAESSIIIIACRRLAPAAIGIGMSEKDAGVGKADRPSGMTSKPGVAGVVESVLDGGRALVERCVGRTEAEGGGEGDGRTGACGLSSGFVSALVGGGRPRSFSFSRSSSSSSSSSLDLIASSLASVQSMTRPIVMPPPSASCDDPEGFRDTPCWIMVRRS